MILPWRWRIYEQGHTPTGGTRTLWVGHDDENGTATWQVRLGQQEVCTTSDRAHAVVKYEELR